MRAAVLAVALALGGCATRVVVAPREPLPVSMTTCPPEPDLRRVHDDAGVAHGIAELAAVGRACRHHLDATRATLDAEH